MMFRHGLTVLLTAATANVAQPALAARVDLTMVGQFTIGDRRGQSFTANIGYDTDATPTSSNGAITTYMNAGDIFTITIDGTTFDMRAASRASRAVAGDATDSTFYDLSPPRGEVEITPAYRRVTFTDPAQSVVTINFFDYSSNPSVAPTLPSMAQLADFDLREITFCDAGRCGTGTFTFAVPEPATWGMMILGFGAIGAAMRMRRRRISVSFG